MSPAKAVTLSDGDLIKGTQPAVYYFRENKRFAFPNEQVYYSWYSDFSRVKTIDDAQLKGYALTANMTLRPGTTLVKIQTDPKVYAMDSGTVLHWIETEDLARQLYGEDWAKKVRDVSDALFTDYTIGIPFTSVDQHNVTEVTEGYKDPARGLYNRKFILSF